MQISAPQSRSTLKNWSQIRGQLLRFGHTETNFDQGLELLDERRYDVVILDVRVQADGTEELEAGIRLLDTLKKLASFLLYFTQVCQTLCLTLKCVR